MKFLKKHLTEVIFLIVFLIIVSIATVTFIVLWNAGTDDKYGNRLEGIENYPLSEGYINDIKGFILNEEFVNKVDIDKQGRLINFTVTVLDNTPKDKAKGLGKIVIEGFTKEELEFYDLQIYVLDLSKAEESLFPIIGYKHKNSESFVWSNN